MAAIVEPPAPPTLSDPHLVRGDLRPAGLGGVRNLLRLARDRCRADVAFSALRAGDGSLSIAAYPEAAAATAGLGALRDLAEQLFADLKRSGGSPVRHLCDGHGVVEAVALGSDAPGGPFGLLVVAGPLSGEHAGARTAVLSDLGRRLAAYLRARQVVLCGEAASVPGPEGAGPRAPQTPTVAGPPEARGRLARLAVRGGAYLVGREAIGMAVRLAGVVVTVRIIGPSAYGIYAAAAAFVLVVAILAQMGSEVYLIRHPGEVEQARYDQAFTFLVCTSLLATGLAEAATFAAGGLLRPVGVLLPLRVLLLSIPVNVLWAPAQAKIERRFAYRQMGLLELGGDVVLYATAVPLAVAHFGEWSLVIATFALQSWLLVGAMVLAPLRPRWRWSWPEARAMARHGFGYSSAVWINRLTGVINALVVGTFVGAAGVGFVSFAQNLVTTIGFGARGAYRLGLVALSKVPDSDRARLRYAIEEGSTLQLIALAVPFAAFAVVARWIIPLLFGAQWKAAIPVYCFLALATMLNAPSLIQTTFMLSRGDNMRVAFTAIISTTILAATAVVLVRAFGTVGFGVALVLSMADTLYSDRVVRRTTPFDYRSFAMAAIALCPAVFFPLLPLPQAALLLAPTALLVVVPTMRHEALRISKVVRSSLTGAPA